MTTNNVSDATYIAIDESQYTHFMETHDDINLALHQIAYAMDKIADLLEIHNNLTLP